jgi:hypothetical protein
MSEDLATILALLSGIAAAAGVIITSIKKVGEGNYATLKQRLIAVEKNQARQNKVIGFLTEWQLVGRHMIRILTNERIEMGAELTPEMQALQVRLDKELTLEELMDEDEEDAPRRGRHRGSV